MGAQGSEKHGYYDVTEMAQEFEGGEAWRAQLIRTKSGIIQRTAVNVQLIIEHDTRLNTTIRHNSFSKFFEVTNAPWERELEAGKEFVETDFAGLKEYLGKTYGQQFYNKTATKDVLDGLRCRNQYDPLQEYIKEAEKAWDGKPRVCDVFIKYLGAENNEHIKNFTIHFFKGGVARTLDPGCKFDEMIVFTGGYGEEKSILLKKLALSPRFFIENLRALKNSKPDRKICDAFIVEIAELSAMRERELSIIKTFLSSTHDMYAGQYEKYASVRKRRCIFVGTAKNSDVLDNRRFLPIACSGADAEKVRKELTPEEVQQIWGEAVHIYKKDPVLWWMLPEETEIYAKKIAREIL